MLGTIVNGLENVVTNAKYAMYSLSNKVASAAPITETLNNDKVEAEGGMGEIIGYITKGLAAGGVLFIVIGGVQIATAIKSGEQNPEAITGAVKNLIVGAFLMGIGAIVNKLK